MSFEEVIPEMEESEYWTPTVVGEEVEGNIVDTYLDDYNKTHLVLQTPEDEIKKLPGHASLQRYVKKLKLGEYVKVILSEIRKSNNPDYNDANIYQVLKDPDKVAELEPAE